MAGKEPLRANLSPEAMSGFRWLARGATVTALLEVLGREFARWEAAGGVPVVLAETEEYRRVIAAASELAERRLRHQPTPPSGTAAAG